MDYHKERSFATNFFNFLNFFFQFKNLLQRVDLMYQRPKCPFVLFVSAGDFFFLIGIHSFQSWTTTTRHGVTRKRNTKRLRHTGNLFRKNRIKGCVLYILASLLISLNESTCETRKNVSYLTSKALFVLEIIKF